MKFINENWNAFYSFLITRIVAHNWAGCIRLEITSHLCMGHPPCVHVYLLHCCTVCARACTARGRQTYKEKEMKLNAEKKNWYQVRSTEEGGKMRDRQKYEATDCINQFFTSIILPSVVHAENSICWQSVVPLCGETFFPTSLQRMPLTWAKQGPRISSTCITLIKVHSLTI